MRSNIPATERETLVVVMTQAEADLKSAHEEICKLSKIDPAKHTWPEWSPQANSLRWFNAIRERFGLNQPPRGAIIRRLTDHAELLRRMDLAVNRDGGMQSSEPTAALLEQARDEIAGLHAYIWSLDGKTICIRAEGNSFVDVGVVVASDICAG